MIEGGDPIVEKTKNEKTKFESKTSRRKNCSQKDIDNDLKREMKIGRKEWEITTLYVMFYVKIYMTYSVFCIRTGTAM